MASSPAAWGLCLFLLAGAGCDLPAAPPMARLWTMDDYVALYEGAGENNPDLRLPELMPLGMVLSDSGGGGYELTVSPTTLGEYEGAYVTTEVWQGFEEIWAQPLYLLVSGWTPTGAPIRFPADDPRSRPIFSVGPDSAFYSPYWQTFYVEVAPDTAPDAYRSARDVLGDRTVKPQPGPARLASLLRRKGVIEGLFVDRDRYPPLPADNQIGPVKLGGLGLLDGEEIEYIDLGEGGFQWNSELVVEETPLFVPVFRDATGKLRSMEVQTIGGFGPPFSGLLSRVSMLNRPRYGAYWRVYLAVMPPEARVFAPPQFPKVVEALQEAGVPVAEVGPTITALAGQELAGYAQFVGRITLESARCFAAKENLPVCNWLSSQTALEANLAAASIQRTDITVTCPFVSNGYAPVPNP